jgi:hypothetical protein
MIQKEVSVFMSELGHSFSCLGNSNPYVTVLAFDIPSNNGPDGLSKNLEIFTVGCVKPERIGRSGVYSV